MVDFKDLLIHEHSGVENPVIDWQEPSTLPVKAGEVVLITMVRWSSNAQLSKIKLKTLGEVNIALPPKLPSGYRMEFRSDWNDLIDRLYDSNREYTFEELDDIGSDLATLHQLGIRVDWDVIDYQRHPGYFDWIIQFTDSWHALKKEINSLLKKTFPELLENDDARVLAPSMKEALQKMLVQMEQEDAGKTADD
jgi:hypothetical protein